MGVLGFVHNSAFSYIELRGSEFLILGKSAILSRGNLIMTSTPPDWIVVFNKKWENESGLAQYHDFPKFVEFVQVNYYECIQRKDYNIPSHTF
jgi:hypothetical protein